MFLLFLQPSPVFNFLTLEIPKCFQVEFPKCFQVEGNNSSKASNWETEVLIPISKTLV